MPKVTIDNPRDGKCSFEGEFAGLRCQFDRIAALTLTLTKSPHTVRSSHYGACEQHLDQLLALVADEFRRFERTTEETAR